MMGEALFSNSGTAKKKKKKKELFLSREVPHKSKRYE
jgi:hypothetical protein